MFLTSVITSVSAQTSQLATLLHDGNLSIFYGSSALGEAYDAAQAGDVITLSSGQFNACDLTKPLTIRGAGMGLTQMDGFMAPTVISGNFKIAIPENDHYLMLEGIQHNGRVTCQELYDGQFIRCIFGEIQAPNTTVSGFKNLKLFQCDVREGININKKDSGSSITGISSHLTIGGTYANSLSGNYKNCIIEVGTPALQNSLFTDCVLTGLLASYKLHSSSTTFYCVWYGLGSATPFPVENGTNTRLTQDNVFKEGTFYELADELKGLSSSDNTEVGIYGGNMPFDPATTVPQISSFKVSPRTSADGKLSIDIEVEGIKQ